MTCGFENQNEYMHLCDLKSSHTTRVSFPVSLWFVHHGLCPGNPLFSYLSGSPVLSDFDLSDPTRHLAGAGRGA